MYNQNRRFKKPLKPIGSFFAVYVKNVKRFTIWAKNLNEARRLCENRVRGTHFSPVYYSKIIELV